MPPLGLKVTVAFAACVTLIVRDKLATETVIVPLRLVVPVLVVAFMVLLWPVPVTVSQGVLLLGVTDTLAMGWLVVMLKVVEPPAMGAAHEVGLTVRVAAGAWVTLIVRLISAASIVTVAVLLVVPVLAVAFMVLVNPVPDRVSHVALDVIDTFPMG